MWTKQMGKSQSCKDGETAEPVLSISRLPDVGENSFAEATV